MSEPALRALVPQPHAWADYGLAPAQAARLFTAAAAFYRAAPWKYIEETHALRARLGEAEPWDVYVFGSAGTEMGISLLVPEEIALDDWINRSGYDAEPLSDSYVSARDVLFGLTFTPIDDLAPHIRHELAESGWEVATPAAYPTIGFRGKAPLRVRQREVEMLIAMLEAIPRFVAARRSAPANEPADPDDLSDPPPWTDQSSGVVITNAPEELMAVIGLWETPLELQTCLPEGPGARPEVRVRPRDEQHAAALENEILLRFAAYLQRAGNSPTLSKAAVHRQLTLAQPFAEFLVHRGIPREAINECDLRDFLYMWFPNTNPDPSVAEGVLGTLRRFFAFLDAEDGVRCPWASAILADRHAFLTRIATRPGDASAPEAARWSRELHMDLEMRLLTPTGVPEDGITFGEHLGVVQKKVITELLRVWLVWRDEAIRAGKAVHASILPEVLERQRIWEHTANPLVGGETPARAVAREQEEIRARSRGKRP